MKKRTSSITSIALKLHYFVKNNTYPKENSDKFCELTELFDDLETILREEKFIK